ncbi:MAG: hypothetical protein JSV35_01820 [Candidatus Bathyarchaeota archaeon]|nr:MAG: hypothetical protein JSV35_01820 [Candidatus Bathyarchaeota archaeon]
MKTYGRITCKLLVICLLLLHFTVSMVPRALAQMNVPGPDDIDYGNNPPGSTYGPFTEKAEMFQNFLDLANANPDLVTVQVIGQGYPTPGLSVGWDMVVFLVGNPNGGRVLWDSLMHGNEDDGVEVLFSIYRWLLTSGHPRAQRILANNWVAFFPLVNWRWCRTNYNEDVCPCSGNSGADGEPWGVNIARDFAIGNEQSCPDNWAPDIPPGPYTQPETQACVNFWDTFRNHPNGWIYVNLHCGATSPRSGRGELAGTIVNTLRPPIHNELFNNPPSWNIGTSGCAHASRDAVANYGARGGFIIELESGWRHTPSRYASMTSGEAYREMLSFFVAQCEAVEVDEAEGSLTMSIQGSGSTIPSVGTHTYPYGMVVTLQVTESPEWTFSRWEIDGVTVYSPTYELTITGNHNACAHISPSNPAVITSTGTINYG